MKNCVLSQSGAEAHALQDAGAQDRAPLGAPASCSAVVLHSFGRARRGAHAPPRVSASPRLPVFFLLLLFLQCGCRKAMVSDGRIKPLEESKFFSNGTTARQPVLGTVARGELHEDTAFFDGEVNGRLVTGFPMPVTKPLVERGRERFDIYCSVCHGRTGAGNGMIPQRGFPSPPTFHQDRLRNAPPGYFFGVMTHGYGVMYSYADRVSPADRWAIVAYIRALQLSQNARWNDIPVEERGKIEQPGPAGSSGGSSNP